MISPDDIRKQAKRWWPEVLGAGLSEVPYFPKALRSIGKISTKDRLLDFDRIREQQQALMAASKARQGKGFSLHWEERDYRNVGHNRFIHRITIDSLADYLYIVRKEAAYRRFQSDVSRILEQLPQLREWCRSNVIAIEQHHGAWAHLLEVVQYFLQRHQFDRYYIRELPLAIPTKFVENHRTVLSSLLDGVLPPDRIKDEYRGVSQFEQRYGLKYRQPMVRLRLLDADIAAAFFSGLTDLQLPLPDFMQLHLPLRRVIILENKTNFSNLMNFLTLPQLQSTAGIFGRGFGLGQLKEVSWLNDLEVLYWGDIDAHGLQILSQLRSYFPHTRSFLMDRATLDAFPDYILIDAPESSASQLPHLTPHEQALFDYVNAHRLRLEQERIPLDYVRKALEDF